MRVLPVTYFNNSAPSPYTIPEGQGEKLVNIITEVCPPSEKNVIKQEDHTSSIQDGVCSISECMMHEATEIPMPSKNATQDRLERTLLEFKEIVEEMQAISCASGVLNWDLETYMPKLASEERGWQQGQLSKINHKLLTSERIKTLLAILEEEQNFARLSNVDQRLVKYVSKSHKKAAKIPENLVREFSELTTVSQIAWEAAKRNNDFKSFAPYLEKVFKLSREIAECIGYEGSPYNALLDDYEEGMTTEKLDKVFARLKEELPQIIKALKSKNARPNDSFLHMKYDKSKQLDIGRALLKHIGFDFSIGRLDEVEHPFMTGFSPHDGRITTHVHEDKVMSNIGTCIHEGGHWLYQLGIDEGLYKTPLWEGASFGIHESQSRLYETIVGQGKAFWKYFFPILKHTFPEQLETVSLEDFYNAINIVEPNFIRIESDELTYQMHIVLRYEIERDLIEGKIEARDLPQIWKGKMHEYLGITPETDTIGVLQDVHWAGGLIGYFPTYTLGNLYAAQFYATLKKEIPDIEERIARGDMMTLRNWLKEKIHKYGRTETPLEILKRVTGEDLNPDYFINYIKTKYLHVQSM